MNRKFKWIASTAAVLVLVSTLGGATLSHTNAEKPSGKIVTKDNALPAPAASGGQRHLVRVVDVTGAPCKPSGADPNAIANERLVLLAHRTRLEAEIQGRNSFAIPEELRGQEATEPVQRAFRDEALAAHTRQQQVAEQAQSVQQSIELMKRENEVIEAKDTMMQRQVTLLQQQLDAVDGLLKRGAATMSQKLILEQTLAQYESSHLDLQLSGLKSRQELLKAQQSIADMRNQLRAQDLAELGQTQARLADLARGDAAAAGANKPAEAACDQAPGPVFEIMRGADGSMQVTPIAPISETKPDALPQAASAR